MECSSEMSNGRELLTRGDIPTIILVVLDALPSGYPYTTTSTVEPPPQETAVTNSTLLQDNQHQELGEQS